MKKDGEYNVKLFLVRKTKTKCNGDILIHPLPKEV
jgi:hypothetical protein